MSVNFVGHRKLKQLSAITGLELDGAWRNNRDCEGRTTENGHCVHWRIDPLTGEHGRISNPTHWTSCRKLEAKESRDMLPLESAPTSFPFFRSAGPERGQWAFRPQSYGRSTGQ